MTEKTSRDISALFRLRKSRYIPVFKLRLYFGAMDKLGYYRIGYWLFFDPVDAGGIVAVLGSAAFRAVAEGNDGKGDERIR